MLNYILLVLTDLFFKLPDAPIIKQVKLKNTLFFFLSDNGGSHNNQCINIPLKCFNDNEYEAGHRIPFLMSWPAKLKNGFRFDGLSSSHDLFATCLAAANIKTKPTNKIDGVSLLPFLGGTAKGNPHEELFWRKDTNAAVRKQNYKLILVRNAGYRLYNLHTDLGETLDLQKTDTLLFKTLKNDLSNWESDKMKPIWTEGKT